MGAWYTCVECKAMMVRFADGDFPRVPVRCPACLATIPAKQLRQEQREAQRQEEDDEAFWERGD